MTTATELDVPRELSVVYTPADKAFRRISTSIGLFVLVLTGSIGQIGRASCRERVFKDV